MKNNHLFILLFAVILSSCGNPKKSVVVDNPTNKSISLTFSNGYSTTIGPYGSEQIDFKTDTSTVYANDTLVGLIQFGKKSDYILNPTRSNYYIEEIAYGQELEEQRKLRGISPEDSTKIQMNFLMVDTLIYIGYVKEVNDLLIEKIWDFGLDESVPEQIEMSKYSNGTSKIKVFRKNHFISYNDLININSNLGNSEEEGVIEEQEVTPSENQ